MNYQTFNNPFPFWVKKLNDTIHLILELRYWNQIANGSKTHEYRDNTEFWRKRIFGRKFVTFHRGYTKTIMTFEIGKIEETEEQIIITLGARIIPQCYKCDKTENLTYVVDPENQNLVLILCEEHYQQFSAVYSFITAKKAKKVATTSS